MPYQLKKRGAYWWYHLTVDGVRERKSTKQTDKELAAAVASKRENELRRAAVHGPTSVLTFGSACGFYLDARKPDRFLSKLFAYWENRLVKDITAGAIKAAAQALYPKAGTATWNRQVITPAQAVINHSAELGHCAPIKIRRFKVAKTIRRAVDRDYMDRFVAEASADLGTMMLFMNQSGCRIGPATALTWSNVDLARRTVTLPKDKNGDAHIIDLSPEMTLMLGLLAKDRRKVFGYASRHAVYNGIKGACKRAGIPYLGTHQPGRHSFATTLIVQHGIDPKTVADMGNWKTTRVLMDNYVHARSGKDVINQVFGTNLAQKNGKALR